MRGKLLVLGLVAATLAMGCERGPEEIELSDVRRSERPRQVGESEVPVAKSANAGAVDAGGGEAGGGGGGGGGRGGGGGGTSTINATPIKLTVGMPDENGKAPETRPEIAWDFTVERSTKNMQWPKEGGENEYLTIEGDFQFKLKLKDGKQIDQHVHMVNARRKGTLLEGVEITSHPRSTEEAHAQAENLLKSLGYTDKSLSKLQNWLEKAKAGNFDNLGLRSESSNGRIFTIRIINDGTSELPWSVGLDVDWSKVCGCEG